MKTKTTITEITHEDLVNLLSCASYGSSWFAFDYDSEEYKNLEDKSDDDCIEDKIAKLLLAGKTIEFHDYYAEDEEDFYGNLAHDWDDDACCMVYTITLEDVKKGLEKAFDGNDWERGCVICLVEDDAWNLDQPRAETLCQLIMFGEQIYG